MKHLEAMMLFLMGMPMILLGAMTSTLGELAMLGIGCCLVFLAAARLTGITMFERVMANAMKFLDWWRSFFR